MAYFCFHPVSKNACHNMFSVKKPISEFKTHIEYGNAQWSAFFGNNPENKLETSKNAIQIHITYAAKHFIFNKNVYK
jgi:hypothetical protein